MNEIRARQLPLRYCMKCNKELNWSEGEESTCKNCFDKPQQQVSVEPVVKPDFGGEALKLTGKDLDDLIEIIEIYCRNGYKDLYTKLLKKKSQIVRNISQNSV